MANTEVKSNVPVNKSNMPKPITTVVKTNLSKTNVSKPIVTTPKTTAPVQQPFYSRLFKYVLNKTPFKRLPNSSGSVNVNQKFVALLDKPITILGFQTGMGRNNELIPKVNVSTGNVSTLGNITLKKTKLSHFEQATNEMEDFKEKFGNFFYDKDGAHNEYEVFLSIGTTSTQGWMKTGQQNGYKLIIPPNVSNIDFQQIGTKQSSSEVNHRHLREILTHIGNKKVLCFNSIGSGVSKGNVAVSIEDYQGIGEISKQQKNSSKIKNNPNPFNHVVLDLLACNTSKNIFIFPREGIINGKHLEANWGSKLAKQNKSWTLDIGGDEVFLYDDLGNKDENSLYEKDKGPNHFYATNGFTKEADKMLMDDIINRLLQKKVEINKNAAILGGRKRTKKYKRYKRKSKRA